jgi:hypothetical protein
MNITVPITYFTQHELGYLLLLLKNKKLPKFAENIATKIYETEFDMAMLKDEVKNDLEKKVYKDAQIFKV